MRTAETQAGLAATFRDPDGFVVQSRDRVFRKVFPHGAEAFLRYLDSPRLQGFRDRGALVSASPCGQDQVREALGELPDASRDGQWWNHPRVFFPSYPWEWSDGMLWAAASLTLDLAEGALKDDLVLKDASSDNVLFDGPRPVFVDALSFSPRVPGDPIWVAQAQFEQHFLIPLILARTLGLEVHRLFRAYPKGVSPEQAAALLPGRSWLERYPLRYCLLPTLLARRSRAVADGSLYAPRPAMEDATARAILGRTFRTLRRALGGLAPAPERASHWAGYAQVSNNYLPDERQAKDEFLNEVLRESAPATVLDLGANTGHFACLAVATGACLVAVDNDHAALERVFVQAARESLDITSLLVDLANPSPDSGWRNREKASFLGRAAGRFDLVLALALFHHLLVTERVPLPDLIQWMAEFQARHWVVEWVASGDSNFRQLVRAREALYAGLTRETFEAALATRFDLRQRREIKKGCRWLYWLSAKV
jgi:SAM-dependent methyltransferase